MSIDAVFARIAQLDGLVPSAAPAPAASAAASSPAVAPAPSFGRMLAATTPTATAASADPGPPPGPVPPIVAVAEGEVGQAEQPPGSNDSPRITAYRTATAGSGVGPWCAYFASWAAAQAGTPIGPNGSGSGSVEQVWQWAQQTGRAIPAGPGVTPQPGDLVLWGGRHIGIVEAVLADGSVQTIEGNSGDRVARRVHGAGGDGVDGATGYVQLG